MEDLISARYFSFIVLFIILYSSCKHEKYDNDKNIIVKEKLFSNDLESIIFDYQSKYDISNKNGYFYIIDFYTNNKNDSLFRIWSYYDPEFINRIDIIKGYYYTENYNYVIVEDFDKYIGINKYNRMFLDSSNRFTVKDLGTYSVKYPHWYFKIVNNKIELRKKENDSIVFY